MPNNNYLHHQEFGDPQPIVQDKPASEAYTTPIAVHERLQEWENGARNISRFNLLVTIIEGGLLSFLIQLADAPQANNIQKATAVLMMISRAIVTAIFYAQIEKIEREVEDQLCNNGKQFQYPNQRVEALALMTAITFHQSINHLNRSPLMTPIIFSIMGIEFLTICFRVISRIILDKQALALVAAHDTAKNEARIHPKR